MPGLSYASDDRPVPRSTLVELFFEALERNKGRAALQRMESESLVVDISYEEVLETVKRVVAALEVRGLVRGDRAAILSENRPEWALSDYGCLCAGVVDVPVYSTLTASEVAYMLEDSGAKLVFASTDEQVGKALAAASERGLDIDVVSFDRAVCARVGRHALEGVPRVGRGACLRVDRGGLPSGRRQGRARRRGDAALHVGHHG